MWFYFALSWPLAKALPTFLLAEGQALLKRRFVATKRDKEIKTEGQKQGDVEQNGEREKE